MTKQQKLVTSLINGNELTAKQITARFGLQNPTAAINHVRNRVGLNVITFESVDSKGRSKTKYTLA